MMCGIYRQLVIRKNFCGVLSTWIKLIFTESEFCIWDGWVICHNPIGDSIRVLSGRWHSILYNLSDDDIIGILWIGRSTLLTCVVFVILNVRTFREMLSNRTSWNFITVLVIRIFVLR